MPVASEEMLKKCEKLAEMLKFGNRERNKNLVNLGPDYFDSRVVERNKYILIDEVNGKQASGCYMVDKTDGKVYSIKSAYAVINRNKCHGSLDDIEKMTWFGHGDAWPTAGIQTTKHVQKDGRVIQVTKFVNVKV